MLSIKKPLKILLFLSDLGLLHHKSRKDTMIQIDMFTRAIHDTRIFLASDVSVIQIDDTLSEARFRGFVVHFNEFFKLKW